MGSTSPSDFPRYRTLESQLRDLERAAPDLVTISSIGETRRGRTLWCATVANERSGPPTAGRPALLVTATVHASELAGSRVCLRLLERLVDGYGNESAITRLLDERAFYVIPRVAVDGADAVLETRSWNVRSRRIPLDADDVGPDEVLPEDLTGDGRILTMRWPDPDGDRRLLEDDDRVVVARGSDEVDPDGRGEYYRTAIEGTVPDYRGGPVADPNARNDFNRNFPAESWRPFDWTGHGKYPLSEPETRAVAEFCYDHPNVVGVADLHTGNPAVFYPSAVIDSRGADADLIERIGRRGEELTGFPLLSSYQEARTGEHRTELPGSFKDFAYERLGVPAFVIELGMCYNYLGMETADLAMETSDHEAAWGRRLIEWHDQHPEAGCFHEWEPVDHPQLGEVEVGGWDRVRFANPPPSELDAVADQTIEFLLEFAEFAPAVRVKSPRVESLGGDLHRIAVTIVNRGALSTSVTERGRETVQDEPPTATLLGDVEVVAGWRSRELEHLPARTGTAVLEWVVRTRTPVDGSGVDGADEDEDGVAGERADRDRIGIEVTGARGVFARRWIDIEGSRP